MMNEVINALKVLQSFVETLKKNNDPKAQAAADALVTMLSVFTNKQEAVEPKEVPMNPNASMGPTGRTQMPMNEGRVSFNQSVRPSRVM